MPTLRVLLVTLCVLSSCIAQSSYAQQVLFITGDKPLSSSDTTVIRDLESEGMQVQVLLDASSTASDANGMDLVLISESVLSTKVGNRFASVSVPLVVYESYLYDDLGMSGGRRGNYGNAFRRKSILMQGTHPLTGGLSGSVKVSNRRARLSWAKPGSEAIVAATLRGDRRRATIFGYEAGATLANGQKAPARRVGLFPHVGSIDSRTPASRDLFLAAVQWALSGPEDNVQVASIEPANEPIEAAPAEPEAQPDVAIPPPEPQSIPMVDETSEPAAEPVVNAPGPVEPEDKPEEVIHATQEPESSPVVDETSEPAVEPVENAPIPVEPEDKPEEVITTQEPEPIPVEDEPSLPAVESTNDNSNESDDQQVEDTPGNPVDTASVEIPAEEVSEPPEDVGDPPEDVSQDPVIEPTNEEPELLINEPPDENEPQPESQPVEDDTVVAEAPVEQTEPLSVELPPVSELPNVAPQIADTSYQCDPATESVAYSIGDTDFFTLSVDDESPLTLTYEADSSNDAVASISVDENGVFKVTALSRGESYLWLVAEDESGLADEFELTVDCRVGDRDTLSIKQGYNKGLSGYKLPRSRG